MDLKRFMGNQGASLAENWAKVTNTVGESGGIRRGPTGGMKSSEGFTIPHLVARGPGGRPVKVPALSSPNAQQVTEFTADAPVVTGGRDFAAMLRSLAQPDTARLQRGLGQLAGAPAAVRQDAAKINTAAAETMAKVRQSVAHAAPPGQPATGLAPGLDIRMPKRG